MYLHIIINPLLMGICFQFFTNTHSTEENIYTYIGIFVKQILKCILPSM